MVMHMFNQVALGAGWSLICGMATWGLFVALSYAKRGLDIGQGNLDRAEQELRLHHPDYR